ncbi:MAG: hypothetical protein IPK82_08930 [Polyangiaceae bacterium]|nr:hypothetical protein [Polyangiaceae bacterium]
MVRTIAMLVAAITMSRPTIVKDEATRYAKILNEIGSKYDFDPLYAVAMIHYESHWLPSAASDDGEDFGLGQVRARFVGACRTDEDPINAPSDACKAVKQQLLQGETNLRQVGVVIGANKKMCAEKRGKNKPEYWIAGYQGLSQPERNKYCVPGPTTTRVLDYHKDLLAALVPSAKPTKQGTTQAKGTVAKTSTPGKAAAAGTTSPPAKTAAKTTAAKTSKTAPKAAPAKTDNHAKPKQAQSQKTPTRGRK